MQIVAFSFFALITILSFSVLVTMLSGNAARIAAALRGDVVISENRVTFVTFKRDQQNRYNSLDQLPLAA